MRNQLGESRDLKEERDHNEYVDMLETVRKEWAPAYAPFQPDGYSVHLEAMRRLKEKYPQE